MIRPKSRKDIGKILVPQPREEIVIRGVTFFTRNLGATDPFSGKFVWFAVGAWTHDQADGVFSDLEAAVADRFDLWDSLGFAYASKFRTSEQMDLGRKLTQEIEKTVSFSTEPQKGSLV